MRARPTATALRAALLLGVAGVAGSCGGGDSTGPNEPPPATPVATVELTPATLELQVGGTSRLTATPRAASGAALTGRTITWASADPDVASVDDEGLVTALAEGEVAITATSEGKAGTAAVTILTAGSVARTWKGRNSGLSEDWSDPANWEPSGTPGEMDLITIPAGTDLVHIIEDVQVARLTIRGGLLNINDSRLLVKALPPPPLARKEQP